MYKTTILIVALFCFLTAAGMEGNIDIHNQDANGNTHCHLAARNNNVEVATFLVREGARLDTQNNDGDTVLHTLATFGSETACRELLKCFQQRRNVIKETTKTFLLVLTRHRTRLPRPIFSYVVSFIYPGLSLYSEESYFKQDLEQILKIKNKENLTAYELTRKTYE